MLFFPQNFKFGVHYLDNERVRKKEGQGPDSLSILKTKNPFLVLMVTFALGSRNTSSHQCRKRPKVT